MSDIKEQVKQLSQSEFEDLIGWMVTDERNRRREAEAKEKAQAAVVADLVEKGKIDGAPSITTNQYQQGENPPEWENPGTDITRMYPEGAVVSRKGRVYISRVAGLNSWEPGGDGVYNNVWLDITTTEEGGGDRPDGSREHPWPFEPGRTATTGQFVTYDGRLYRMAQNHTMVDHYRPGPGLESIYEPVE